MPTQRELEEMAKDYEDMERQLLQDAEELRQLRSGEKIVTPVSMDHAIWMLRQAQSYLSAERHALMNTIKGKEYA